MNADKGKRKVIADTKNKITSGLLDDDIKKVRVKYRIPVVGYEKNTEKIFDNSITNIISLPKEWLSHNNKEVLLDLLKDIGKIRKKFFLGFDFWVAVLLDYVFINKLNDKLIEEWADNLCILTDTKSASEIYTEDGISKSERKKYLKHRKDLLDNNFPIILRINPYATLNDIKDYLNNRNLSIKRLQDEYKNEQITIGKTRTRITGHQRKFLVNNKEMPRKQLAKFFNVEFGKSLGEHEINDLLSKNIKK